MLPLAIFSKNSHGHGEILAYKGKVYVLEYKKGYKKVEVTGNRSIEPKDIIMTGKKSRVKIRLADGSEAIIKENSRIEFGFLSEKSQRIEVGTGGIMSKVNKVTVKKGYSVNSPESFIGVRGTQYVVEYDENKKTSNVDVYEGAVNIKRKLKKKVLTQGENKQINYKHQIRSSETYVKQGKGITYSNKKILKVRDSSEERLKNYEGLAKEQAKEISGWEYD